MKLNVLDLFSGIGGFSLGLESTGYFKTIAFVEKDKFCQRVLQKNFPGISIEDEIRNVKGKEYKADVVTGGFPCQSFSVAGKRKGTDDDRYLWPEMLRVITEVKPRWVVGENVQGIINIDNGLVLRQVQTDLEAQGFQVQCFLIPASGIGAWHRRNRVWILAHSNDNGSFTNKNRRSIKKTIYETQKRENFTFNPKRSGGTSSTENNVANSQKLRPRRRSSEECGTEEGKFQQTEQKRSSLRSEAEGCSSQNVSNSKSSIRNVIHSDKEFGKAQTQEISGNGNSLSEQKQSETWWQTESKLRRVPDGICTGLDKDRANRIKSLGNSIVPQIAHEIGKAIAAAEEQE
jgi:DNA (cytosine-5)-methyltransferase 1